MRALLEFTLPEDSDGLDCARKGASYLATLDEIEETIKQKVKHGPEPEREGWERAQELVREVRYG